MKRERNRAPAYALAYTWSLPVLKKVANRYGYALAVHGSLRTDLDLLLAPWTDEAKAPDKVVAAMAKAVGGFVSGGPTEKPHGRLAWVVVWVEGGGPYLDISVMPRIQTGTAVVVG